MYIKGQVFSFDFLLASSIFLLSVGVLFVYWIYTTLQIEETGEMNEMIDKAYKASEVWFREGVPQYWSLNDVIDLGLENDHRFNQTKMDMMKAEIGYEKTKNMIGLSGYEYNFSVYNSTSHLIWSVGQVIPSDSQNIVNVKRFGILNGSIVTLQVVVWR